MRIPFTKKALPPVTSFLPAIVGVLIVGLFLMAGLALLTPHLEPEPRGPRGNVTGYSAQGFKGLREILDARGATTALARQETGPVSVADLAIVTLDSDGAIYNDDPEYSEPVEVPASESASTSSSSSSSSSSFNSASVEADRQRAMAEASASQASQNASSTSAQTGAGREDGDWAKPNAEKSTRLLYKPVGRVVLVVAPKWDADLMPSHPRWGIDPFLKHPDDIFLQLALLSPIHKTAMKEADGSVSYRIDYRRVDYSLTRAPAAKYRSFALNPAAGQDVVRKAYTSGRIRGLQSIRGANLTPLLLGPDGEVLLSRVNPMPGDKPFKAPVYLLSDPDLLNNQILSDAERVAGALSIIDAVAPGAKTVNFDVTFNDLAYEQDLMHHVARAPFIGVPLAMIVLALGMLWSALSRFGPAHDPATDTPHGRGVTVLADNAARLIAKAGREPKLAPAYAQMVRDQALKAVGLTQHRAAPDDLAERLSEKHNTPERYSALRAEADRVRNPMQLLNWARRLHAWKHQITER
ncbi:MAG: hypothetical protein QM667_02180 [Asticcacaulis sp.]